MAPVKTSALSACLLCFIISGPFFVKSKGHCRSKPGRETCLSSKSMLCNSGQRPQIVEAYFVNATDHYVCGANCKATPAADGDFQCLADITQTEFQCVRRLGYTDLGVLYNTCVRPLLWSCTFGENLLLSLRSTFSVDYLCVQENSTIDPCLTFKNQGRNSSLWLPYSTTSCHSVCEITPVNTERSVYFKYQLIQGFTQTPSINPVVRDNNITYEITFTPSTGKTPQWEQLHSSYYDDYQLWQDVDKLRIRFHIPRGDVVRHLWISFNDTDVNISCTADSTSPTTAGINSNARSETANTASSTPDSIASTPSHQTPLAGNKATSEEDTDVNISCTADSTSPTIVGINSNARSETANTASSTPDSIASTPSHQTTNEPRNEEGDQNPTLVITIVAVVLGVAVLVLVVATVFIIRKRRGRQKGKLNAETKGDNNERQPDNLTNASLPSPNYGDYTECGFVPGDSNPDPAPARDPEAEAVLTALPGCDVGDEYGHLQHDARVGMAGGSEESENYDHMRVGMSPRSDVYNVLQREEKKQDSNPDPAPARDSEAEAVMTAHPGCDVGDEYGHLQHDARVAMAGGSEESENYDHMPVGIRPRSDVYNVLQREEKKQEVVDNVYNTTSLN